MVNTFDNKIIWITGASSGIGEALAYAFSSQGAKLILSSRRLEELERVRKSCTNIDVVKILPFDLLSFDVLEEKTKAAIACFGQIDIMVHNGGISQRSLAIDTPIENHRRLMDLDYFSYVAITQALLPHFEARKAGHFVVITSVLGKIGLPLHSSYAAAKHALHGYFDSLRAEVAAKNIHVTLIIPGYIQTNIFKDSKFTDGKPNVINAKNTQPGITAETAASKILIIVAKGSYESFVGKFGMEKVALWLNSISPQNGNKIYNKILSLKLFIKRKLS